MDRVDIFSSAHKGLRSQLFEVARQIGRTDFRSQAEVVALAAAVRRLCDFLTEHAQLENEQLMPEIASLAPWAHAELAAEHTQLEGKQREILTLLDRIESVEICERVSLGLRLLRQFNVLVADQIQHMEREESSGNRVLWAHRSDEELLALQRRMIESIQAPRLLEWAEMMAPALSSPELERLSAGLRGVLPADAVATVSALTVRGSLA